MDKILRFEKEAGDLQSTLGYFRITAHVANCKHTPDWSTYVPLALLLNISLLLQIKAKEELI